MRSSALLAALTLSTLLLAACTARPPFAATEEQFAYDYLALFPTTATASGYHLHHGLSLDDRLEDYTPAGIERQLRFFHDAATTLDRGFDPASLSAEDRADFTMMRDQVNANLLDLETIQSFRHNPTTYVETLGNAIYTPYTIEYAPKADRYRHVITRLQKIPAFLATAQANLTDAPEIWNQVARQENDGNITLIDKTVRNDAPADLRTAFDDAAGPALDAMRKFNVFLKDSLSTHVSDWRLGPTNYAHKFRNNLETDRAPDQVLADAEEQLKAIREQMLVLARGMNPAGSPAGADLNQVVSAALNKVALKHTTRENYGADARRDLAEATQFIRDHKLLPLPPGSNLQVIDTPEFMRGIYSVGGFSPAPALEPQLGAFYWLTPIPPAWTPERVESKLREYNFYGLKILTVHEAMPGHYVQAEYAARIQPISRRIFRALFGNGPYIEGWAVYVTQMMIAQGYYDDPEMRLTFLKQMLRVVSNTILDVRLHTKGMTDQQAMDLMIHDTFQENQEAVDKLVRAKLSSCQLPTYFVGWRDWQRVLDQFRRAQSSQFQLADFHQRSLKEGAVPLPALARLLTGEDLR
jgi:uncharacterized protein (DUF885 family)